MTTVLNIQNVVVNDVICKQCRQIVPQLPATVFQSLWANNRVEARRLLSVSGRYITVVSYGIYITFMGGDSKEKMGLHQY